MQVVDWMLLFTWAFGWWVASEWTEQAYLNGDNHFWKTINLHFQGINIISRNCLFRKNFKPSLWFYIENSLCYEHQIKRNLVCWNGSLCPSPVGEANPGHMWGWCLQI